MPTRAPRSLSRYAACKTCLSCAFRSPSPIAATRRIGSPYVKTNEMDWLLCQLSKRKIQPLRIRLVTDIRSENVLSGSLDLEALQLLIDGEPAQVINLPRLHAKA